MLMFSACLIHAGWPYLEWELNIKTDLEEMGVLMCRLRETSLR
jgi:hypothetical protein